jgi:2-oxoglutarate dehydrogenase E2 component (dihydrolipoamide succinyltransferase)
MTTELKIPEVGESVTEVQIGEWLKSEGDEIKLDEPLAVIDSEKTTFELPAPEGGRLAKILHRAGETVKVGEAIAQIEADGKSAAPKSAPPKKTDAHSETKPKSRPESKSQPAAKAEPEPQERPAPQPEPTKAEPEPQKTSPSQPKSATSETPVVKAKPTEPPRKEPKPILKPEAKDEPSEAEPKDREEEVVPMTMLRRTVARRLVEAQQTMAMLTTFTEVDMTATQALRKEHAEKFEKRYQVRLGLMSFFVKAAVDALKQFPKLNAEIRETDIVYRNYFDIGVAIATERGLVVPVLRRAERLSFAELEKTISDFAESARNGKLKPDELEGGTFTITNGGVFGSLLSTPIINPPQTGILGMHTIQERPVAIAGQVVVRPMMYLALSYDHRLVDGREAVLFLRRIKEAIEAPARMLIEI